MAPYYIFQPACNTAETGPEFPQVQKMAADYNYKLPNSVNSLSKAVYNFPELAPNLNYFVLQNRAKLTDLLSVAPVSGGLLVSARFQSLLEKFKIANHRFYPARVSFKKKFYDYYWIHIISNLGEWIDYPNSTLYIYYNYNHNLGYVNINSAEDFKQQKEKLKKDNPGKTITIWAEKIKLKANFDSTIDLFDIGTVDANYYISERLRTALLSAEITGCEIKLANNISI